LHDFRRKAWEPNGEIAAAEFFDIDSMPEGATGGTRRRLLEIEGKQKPSSEW
jgi:hypothetical protein